MRAFIALCCGFLFGVGLAASGMTNPAIVLGFLDPLGDWDPTLVFVMAGAVLVATGGFTLARRMQQPWLDVQFHLPTRQDIDADLIAGAVLFGIGWGLVGVCPGPAIANLCRGSLEASIFAVAMAAGVLIHHLGPAPHTAAHPTGVADPDSPGPGNAS